MPLYYLKIYKRMESVLGVRASARFERSISGEVCECVTTMLYYPSLLGGAVDLAEEARRGTANQTKLYLSSQTGTQSKKKQS